MCHYLLLQIDCFQALMPILGQMLSFWFSCYISYFTDILLYLPLLVARIPTLYCVSQAEDAYRTGGFLLLAFFQVSKPLKGARSASALQGPQLCTPDNIATGVNKSPRLLRVKDTIITDKVSNNKALMYADIVEQVKSGAVTPPGQVLQKLPRSANEQMSRLHWSTYIVDSVYAKLLVEIAQQINLFARVTGIGQRCVYKVTQEEALNMCSKKTSPGVLLTLQNPGDFNLKPSEAPSCILPQKAFQALQGVLISDGGLHKAGPGPLAGNINRNPYLEVTMKANASSEQSSQDNHLGLDYALFMAALLEMLGLGYGMVEKRVRWYNPDIKHPSGHSGLYYEYHFVSIRSMEFRILESLWYTNVIEDKRIKVAHPATINLLGSIAWAFAYAGDGGLEKGYTPIISFQSFGQSGCGVVADHLKLSYGESITVRNNSNGSVIALNVPSGRLFSLDVLPYLPYSAHYKINPTVLGDYLSADLIKTPQQVPGIVVMRDINNALQA